MSIQTFSDWLYATPFSTALRETSSVIPAVQSVHILAISVIIGSAVITELRLAGVFAKDQPVAAVLRRYLPWMRRALVILLLTGLMLVVAEPARTLGNTLFWIKMVLVAGASIVTLAARNSMLDSYPAIEIETDAEVSGAFEESGLPEPLDDAPMANDQLVEASKSLAWFMIVVWCTVIFCGRFIAYT